jgi:hypothetical protein
MNAAKAAYAASRGNIFDAATYWGKHAQNFYSALVASKDEDARDEIVYYSATLVSAIFVGRFQGRIRGMTAMVGFEPGKYDKIVYHQEILIPRDLPYSGNSQTSELIEGTSPQALSEQAAWDQRASSIAPARLEEMRLKFFIGEAAKYEQDIGDSIDVLELNGRGQIQWLERSACTGI